jgi:hypothetical protein
MNRAHYLRLIGRFAAVLAGLAAALAAFGTAPAFAMKHLGLVPDSAPPTPPVSYPCTPECSPLLDKHLLVSHGHWTGTVHHVHTIMVGGMPGWQIALIATGAALFAAIVAVLLDRAQMARKLRTTTA